MPGVVEDHVRRRETEAEHFAQYQLLHELEKPYAPDPYRPHDSEWQVAQDLAQRDLHKLESDNPGVPYTELLEKALQEAKISANREAPFDLDYSQDWRDEGYKW